MLAIVFGFGFKNCFKFSAKRTSLTCLIYILFSKIWNFQSAGDHLDRGRIGFYPNRNSFHEGLPLEGRFDVWMEGLTFQKSFNFFEELLFFLDEQRNFKKYIREANIFYVQNSLKQN